jgi:hypothetical protein
MRYVMRVPLPGGQHARERHQLVRFDMLTENRGNSCIDNSNRRYCILSNSSARSQSDSGDPMGIPRCCHSQYANRSICEVSISTLSESDPRTFHVYRGVVGSLSQLSERISPMRASPDTIKVSSPSLVPKYGVSGSTTTSRESLRARRPRPMNSSKRTRSGPATCVQRCANRNLRDRRGHVLGRNGLYEYGGRVHLAIDRRCIGDDLYEFEELRCVDE